MTTENQIAATSEVRQSVLNLPLATWTKARFIANSRLPQASALIPIIGYALLWSDQLSSLAVYSKLEPALWFSPIWRLRLLYWGACSMTVGWLAYLTFCPKVIRRSAEPDDYVLEQLRFEDLAYIERVRLIAASFLEKQNFHPMDGRVLVFEKLSPAELHKSVNYLQNHGKLTFTQHRHLISSVLTLHYWLENTDRQSKCWFTLAFLAGGAFLFLLPSLEVFLMILRTTVLGT